MARRLLLTVGLVVGCMWCCALVAGGEQPPAATPSPRAFKPVATLDSLMHGQGDQFQALTTLVENPQAEKRGHRLFIAAELLAEFANINTFHKDKDDYRGWASKVRDLSLELAGEAKKEPLDDARLTDLLATLKQTCTSCHDVYQ